MASGDLPDSPDSPEPGSVTDIGRPGSGFYTYVTGEDGLARCVDSIRASNIVGLDLETTSFDWWAGEIRIISVTTRIGEAWVVDAAKVDPEPLYRALEDTRIVVHNAAFDVPYLLKAGCTPKRVGCTKILSRLRFAGAGHVQHSLVDVIKRHASEAEEALAAISEAKDDIDHDVWKRPTLGRKALDYAANDSRYLIEVYEDELRTLEHINMDEIAELEERFVNVVAEASATGMPVDPDRWGAVIEEATGDKMELAKQLDGMLDGELELPEKFTNNNSGKDDVHKINWSSPEQKIWAIESLGLAVPTKWDPRKKQEKQTLDKDHLHLLNHPVAEALGDYQAIAPFPATFANALEERFADGWVYPDWQQLQARTGRMSCCNPPMHNIPRKSKLREAIVAPEGYRILTADFSQIEPRVLAALSKDRALLKAFRDGEDVYRFVASKVTGVTVDEVTKDLRSVFKTIVLGLIYGMSEYGLSLRVHRDIDPSIPDDHIVAYRDGFFAAFPEASKWREDLEAEFDNGDTETRTILGRRRLHVENRRQRWNAPIQGTACDAFKLAAVNLYERKDEIGGFRIIALIHDEVVLLVPEERAEEVQTWARKVMEDSAAEIVNRRLPKHLHIPIAVDSGSGKTLQEAKDAAA